MPLLKALLCQILAASITALLADKLGPVFGVSRLIWLQPLLAALLSAWFRQAVWWLPMHLGFMPAAWFLWHYHLPAWIYLGLFLLLLGLFWGTAKGDVPLFLSSKAVGNALQVLAEQRQADSLIDLGAGIGSVVIPLAKQLPHLKITAVEQAPLPWLILSWRCRGIPNIRVRRINLWQYPLADQAIVFVFLSPLVMARMGEKCRNEMRPGSLLVSSCFEIPDWQAHSIVELADGSASSLYCYHPAAV